MRKFLSFPFLSFPFLSFPFLSFADTGYLWYMWDFDITPNVTSSVISENSQDVSITFNFPLYTGTGTAVLRDCKDYNGHRYTSRGVFFLSPKKIPIVNGLGTLVYSSLEGGDVLYDRNTPADSILASDTPDPYSESDYPLRCDENTPQGGMYAPLKVPATKFKINYKLTGAGDFPSGSYTVPVNFNYIVEEHHKGGSGLSSQTFQIGSLMKQYAKPLTVQVPVNISTKCTYSTNNLIIDHGAIKPVQSISQPLSFNINCNRAADVTLNIMGNIKNGESKCGDGGNCIVTFDAANNNLFKKEMKNVVGSKDQKIYSTFQPGSNIVPGPFEGSVVLQIYVK